MKLHEVFLSRKFWNGLLLLIPPFSVFGFLWSETVQGVEYSFGVMSWVAFVYLGVSAFFGLWEWMNVFGYSEMIKESLKEENEREVGV